VTSAKSNGDPRNGGSAVATIRQVAARADVSPATVSRVLNGTTVDPVLAARVRTAVKELNYRPSNAARSLRTRRTKVWGLVISDVRNPFFTDVVRGIEDTAQRAGYAVVLCNADEQLEKERAYVDLVVDERMAGIILSPASPQLTDVGPLVAHGIPVVTVDRTVQEPEVDAVVVDNASGAGSAVRHLYAGGYRRIACITGPQSTTTGAERLTGYVDALDACGLDRDPALIVVSDFKEEGGMAAMRQLLGVVDPPDAVVVANSVMGMGALRVLHQARVAIPRELGLVCFDDAPWMALTAPTVTAVAQPTYAIGCEAARLLLSRIDGERLPARRVTMSTKLVPRESSQRDGGPATPRARH
jgi:LacI family transcriptional regulator